MKKPACAELVYAEPSPEEKARAAEMRATVRKLFRKLIDRPGEDLFAFIRDLSATGYRHTRDRSARPSPDEVDLTRGWAVIAGKELAEAAQRFRNYLRDAMGADVKEGAAPNVIRLHIDGERVPETDANTNLKMENFAGREFSRVLTRGGFGA